MKPVVLYVDSLEVYDWKRMFGPKTTTDTSLRRKSHQRFTSTLTCVHTYSDDKVSAVFYCKSNPARATSVFRFD